MKTVYELVIEDASHLGNAMGTEYTTVIDSELYSDLEKAKNAGEKFAKKFKVTVEWKYRGGSEWSNDIGSHIISIKRKKVL